MRFALFRLSPDEKVPRTIYSRVGKKCGGKMKKISDLMDVRVSNLYQCPNYPALLLTRGAGMFDIDWENKEEVEDIGNKWICATHEAELGRNWDNPGYKHYRKKERKQEANRAKRYDSECSMPPPFFQHNDPVVLHRDAYFIEADEARAILKMKGVHISPGLPVCAQHNEEAKKILAQETVEANGHNIRPAPIEQDFSKTPKISRDVNPYSDDRDESDPSYHSHHRQCPAPIRREYIPPPKFPAAVKDAYKAFMESLGLDPSIASKNWHELDERTQRRKAEGLQIASNAMAHFMAPADPESLTKKAFKMLGPYERPRPKEFIELWNHVRGAFYNALSRGERIAALSMVSHFPLSEIQKYLPNLSSYYLDAARKYALRGYHRITFKRRRMRFEKPKVNRYLEFVVSYKVTLNSPYGTREVKDSLGKFITIPNTLRKLRMGEMYHLYKKDLTVNNEEDLIISESSARRIAKVCAAERRKSLHGVDIVIADAMDCFDRAAIAIEKMLEKNWISKLWHDSLYSNMLASRQYLRTDYLIHTKEWSTIGDHCWSYALSDETDAAFQVDCRQKGSDWMHSHTRVCHQCETVQVWYGDMRATLEQLAVKHKEDKKLTQEINLLRRDLYHWESKIEKLKAHQLRTAKSEYDRQQIVGQMKQGDCLLTLDFAMKALPLNPRESTTDWYAQRGMPWHIGNGLFFDQDQFWQHRYVQFIKGDRQDSAMVTGIIRSILYQLHTHRVRRVWIRSDQAGPYKSSSTIASVREIAQEVGIEVVGWYFSEPQSGKGVCDRDAATVKGIFRGYADSGKPVTNPDELFYAVTQGSYTRTGFSYETVRLEGGGEDNEITLSESVIPNLSKYNAFTFEAEGIRVHRYWKIGEGKIIPYTSLKAPNVANLVAEKAGGALREDNYWAPVGESRKKKHRTSHKPTRKEEEDEEGGDEEEEDANSVCEKDKESKECKEKKEMISALYRCPVESCAKEFITEKNLEVHLTIGKHLRRPESENMLDYSPHSYSSFVEAVFPPRVCPLIDEATAAVMNDNENGVRQKMGWGIPTRQPRRQFPKTVKTFLRKIYDEGEKTGAKTDARGAEELMRTAEKPNGDMLFDINDLLTSRQIAGVFSRFKGTSIEARKKAGKKTHKKKKLNEDEAEPMEVVEEEVDEVNQLFDTEGDEELEFETEPLFDEYEIMKREVQAESHNLFKKDSDPDDEEGDDEEEEEENEPRPNTHKKRLHSLYY